LGSCLGRLALARSAPCDPGQPGRFHSGPCAAPRRYAEAHECTFDYKKMERQRLAKNNPLVQASKVDKL